MGLRPTRGEGMRASRRGPVLRTRKQSRRWISPSARPDPQFCLTGSPSPWIGFVAAPRRFRPADQ
eukprot:4953025-Lingulodinium_polyedra.AAC.1